jgi:hypothetical protein
MRANPDLPVDRHWSSLALAGLVPTPEPDLADANMYASIKRAREHWPAPHTFSGQITRWLSVAQGHPRAADAIVKLSRCAPLAWQATTGLQWMEELVGDNYATVAGRCYYLTQWLEEIRAVLPGETGIASWQHLVDGLASAGDNRAARLQQAEE